MKKLFVKMPAFASDYGGAMAVFFEMNCLKLVHGPGGCCGNFCHCDELRWQEGTKNIYHSGLRDIEAITGDDSIVIDKVKRAFRDIEPRFVVFAGSPITMLIGTDLNAIGKELEESLGCPVIMIHSTGIKRYDEGQSEAYQSLVDTFVTAQDLTEGCPDANLIGATPLDGWEDSIVNSMKTYLGAAGYNKVSVWGMGSDVDEISKASAARKNYALNVSALKAARMLRERYGIPYETGIPIAMGRQLPEFDVGGSRRILIIAEQLWANSVRNALREIFSEVKVDVASFFMMENEYMESEDIMLTYESDLEDLIEARAAYDLVIGDAYVLKVLPKEQKCIRVPHPAVSAHNNTPDYTESTYRPYMMTVVGEWNTPQLLDLIDEGGAISFFSKVRDMLERE